VLPNTDVKRLESCLKKPLPALPVKLTPRKALSILAEDAVLDKAKTDCGLEAVQEIGAVRQSYGK
jgi:hypothetical protein